MLFEHRLEFMEHILSLPSNQPDTVLIAGQTSSVEFWLSTLASSSVVVVRFGKVLPSSWSDPIWDKPQGYSLQVEAHQPVQFQNDVPEGDLQHADKSKLYKVFADIDGTTNEAAVKKSSSTSKG